MSGSIVRVTRDEVTEVYRIRLLRDGSASLERFENGSFSSRRRFRGWAVVDPTSPESCSLPPMERATRYISGFLDGAVSVGERDLLSPASAMARNVRWFPGDVQMLETSFAYVRELFPCAQFHITQLFRRLFGDAAFLLLIVVSGAFWLRTDAPVGMNELAVGLLVLSMVAIIGVDRYLAPLRRVWQELRQMARAGHRLEAVFEAPLRLGSEVVRCTVPILIDTLVGLSNLVINPLAIFGSWRALRRGQRLEWKASSVSAGQDMRGWPLREFVDAYAPALKVGVALLAFLLWLVALGAPFGILGLSGLGVFLASFLTAGLYAWYSALPRRAGDGRAQYRLPRRELWLLVLAGAAGLGLSFGLWRWGLYPLPAFEGSAGIVVLFLSLSAAFALAYPVYYRSRLGVGDAPRQRDVERRRWALVLALGALLLGLLVLLAREREFGADKLVGLLWQDEAKWRMPEPERRVYEDVRRSMRRYGRIDPAPLLTAEGARPMLEKLVDLRGPDLRELRGLPSARLPRLLLGGELSELPELYPLPVEDRLPILRPAREFAVPAAEPTPQAPLALEVGRRASAVAQRRALALTPRALSQDELRLQDEFIERADYPWIGREELRRLAASNAGQASVPLVEMARTERWDDLRELWDQVEAARRGGAPDRIRLERLRDGVQGALELGTDPTPERVQSFLDQQLALVAAWSKEYPHLPLSSLGDAPSGAQSRFFQVNRFLLQKNLSRAELARDLRLDYVDAYWQAPSLGEALHQAFRERVRAEPWEQLKLDWDGNERLRRRWEDLQSEQAVAMKIWSAAAPSTKPPSATEMREVVAFLEHVLEHLLAAQRSGPYAVLADLFRLEGVDQRALQSGDTVAALVASRVWTHAMAGRVARIVSKGVVGPDLFGSEADRALIREVARARYPEDAGDPRLRRAFEWLVLVDSSETYRELAAGYDKFAGNARDLGIVVQGLPRAPQIEDAEIYGDLIDLWRELPRRFHAIPARDDMVAEFLCQTAYFSSRDGRTRRTPRELLDDFAELFAAVDAQMGEAPPLEVQRLTDQHFQKLQGRTSRSPAARRFFAWWMVAAQAKVLDYNYQRHAVDRRADLGALAADWARLLESGAARWGHLPWLSPGFADFFLNQKELQGWSDDQLWQRFESQLTEADRLTAAHTVAFKTFEDVVDRRIEQQTGSFNFDPALRRANALLALADLCSVIQKNGLHECEGNPARVTEQFSLLYEKLQREYPALDWHGEGTLEFYLLTRLRQGWSLYQTLERFGPELSLANALAGRGWLRSFADGARADSARAPESGFATFADAQARRLEMKTGLSVRKPGTRAMNALIALSSLVLSAGEEGQLPMQNGVPWSKARLRDWARNLSPSTLGSATEGWVKALLEDWSALLLAMQQEGPHFPWHAGSIVETNLLAMNNALADVSKLRDALGPSWRAASELLERGVALPPAFQQLISQQSMQDLRHRLASARSVAPEAISDAEVETDEPALIPLNAALALADVMAQIRIKHRTEPDPVLLAQRFLEIHRWGPQRYPFIPWQAKGFVPSLVVAAYGEDFRHDFWKYAQIVALPRVDRLLGELSQRERALVAGANANPAAAPRSALVPAELLVDVRSALYRETGRLPASDALVVFQALQDGAFLLEEFVPELPVTLDNTLSMAMLRARVRRLESTYPELGIVTGQDGSVRVGFAERLAALAMKEGLRAGSTPADPHFVEAAVARVEQRYLQGMNAIYAQVRASFSPEELDYQERTTVDEARADGPRRAVQYGLSPEHLSIPEVKPDDVVADAALYELLYAREMGQGPEYLGLLFGIFERLAQRPESQRSYRDGLAEIDSVYALELVPSGKPGFERWRESAGYRRWWKQRGDFIRTFRGRTISLSRTFALVYRAAFTPESDAAARASFERFGGFDAYLDHVMESFEAVQRVPELAAALRQLEKEDAFLADGVRFALGLFKSHVIDTLFPEPERAVKALASIASALPEVSAEQRKILGFAPRLESGVPLYDARMSFLRRELQPGVEANAFYRLNLVQRSVQRWTQAYVLQQSYRLLFFHDLDMADPTPVPRWPSWGRLERWRPGVEALLNRVWPRSVGDEVTDFLEVRLPERLEAETHSKDLGVWLTWLMQHGEIGLDGTPSGENAYAAEVTARERRLAEYRERIWAGTRAGKNVRAEEQRLRDITREYASFQNQVGWLADAAGASAPLTLRARRDYTESIWLHAIFPLPLILLSRRAARWVARRLPPRRRWAARLAVGLGLCLPLLLAVGIPCLVAWNPEGADRVAGRGLELVRLLEHDAEGRVQLRGAAAQLAKLAP